MVFASMVLSTSEAMNLVPNPSFETYTLCPDNQGQINRAAPWIAPTTGSSDYYNACATGGSGVDVPSNTFGSQLARTGDAYAGFIVRPINEYREYVEIALTQPLLTGQITQVEFWVSLPEESRDAIDRIGAYLSNGSVGPVSNASVLPFTPQVESPVGIFLTDEILWMQVTGSFTAAGGEDHIVVGNFHDNSNTNVQQFSGFYPGSYYYLDDVSVEVTGQVTPEPEPHVVPTTPPFGLMLLVILMTAIGGTVSSLRRG